MNSIKKVDRIRRYRRVRQARPRGSPGSAHERLRRIFSFQSLYAGVAPNRALAAYGVIAYMDTIAGVWFPRGGMRALAQALADAAEAAGAAVPLRTDGHGPRAPRRADHRGCGIAPSDDRADRSDVLPCDAVVLTPDLPIVDALVGKPRRRPVPLRWSPSAVVLHAGLRTPDPRWRTTPSRSGAAWEQTFTEIITTGRLMSDPFVAGHAAHRHRPDPRARRLRPPLRARPVPQPGTRPDRLGARRPAYRDELLSVLSARGHPGLADIADDVTVSRLVTPADWAADGLAAGTPFSAADTFAQTGPFRPRNLVPGLDNAVLAGAARCRASASHRSCSAASWPRNGSRAERSDGPDDRHERHSSVPERARCAARPDHRRRDPRGRRGHSAG